MGIQVDSDNAELSRNRCVICYSTIVKYPKYRSILIKTLLAIYAFIWLQTRVHSNNTSTLKY